jgi:hypothetical protein
VLDKEGQERRHRFMPDKGAQEQRHRFVPGKTKKKTSNRNGTRHSHRAPDGLSAPDTIGGVGELYQRR